MKIKIVLLSMFCFMVVFKIGSIFSSDYFNAHNETAHFWTESALHYRMAQHIAYYGYFPFMDKNAQYPEGVDVQNRLTIIMETISGYMYRFFIPRTVPFHVFLVVFISLYSSLAIFPLYLSIHVLYKSKVAALFGSALYAVTPAVYTTVTALTYELQDFAVPLILFHLYFFLGALKKSGRVSYSYAFLSASFLFVALTSWHFTQFYYTIFVMFIIIYFLFIKHVDVKPFYVITGMNIIAGLMIPTLRSAGFLISFSMLVSYGLVIASVIPTKSEILKRVMLLSFIVIAVLVGAYILFIKIPEYRFVYGLVWDKIKYLGTRPADPSKLSWETLVMWVSPFISPSLSTVAKSIGALFVAGIIGIVIGARRVVQKRIKPAEGLLLYLTCAFFPLYLLLIRLDIFLVWFLAFQSAQLFIHKRKILQLILLVCVIINAFLLFTFSPRCSGPDRNHLLGLMKYIKYNTARNSSILTSFAYGPSILTYSGRPILLHSKFEAEGITTKIKEFEHGLFKDEAVFYDFCKRYKARYFVYQIDMLLARGPETMRYRTHNVQVSKDCSAFAFHFRPEILKFFELKYSNAHYRVYRILEHGESPEHEADVYLRVYDEELFDLKDFGIY